MALERRLPAATAEGGWGGDAFGRENQMAADRHRNEEASGYGGGYGDQGGDDAAGYKTGTSTPGYRQEGGESLNSNPIRSARIRTSACSVFPHS